MNTQATTSSTSISATTSTNPQDERKDILGKDDFLRIFITQLKNQDPLQPLQDKDFIAQMAQFSSLEQITNMANGMAGIEALLSQQNSLGAISNLIGKIGYWENTDGKEQSGLITSVLMKDGEYYVTIGESEIPIYELYKVEIGASS
ncbi:flagellar hook assembly protein FlgD [Tepidibacillus fermentans]|uniref:Flagellar basal-body rod modification protein FlgD n=1 Tax=Tepidibacillus fermentans TaxID=1281767 RepID=A0A4R3KJQ3_9BACI|nr:flagellar hook assembly protein FlgD [Tepidibacillus fermentans]TCS82942.1 flagellar basal-body rod modification protein FlgD [Tepidibacillus fermentans]